MITDTKEKLESLAKTHQCPEHGDKLTVAWHSQAKSYVLRCGEGHFPEEVTRTPTRTQQYKAGELQAVDKSFNLLPKADLETGEVLATEAVQALIAYANRYGLDAYRGHVVMMHGKPYIGMDGYIYHARKDKIPFNLTGRPLSETEMASLGYDVGDLGWRSTLTRLDTNEISEGLGFVKKSEMTEMSKKNPDTHRYPIVADKPGLMLVKRADWQALRRAFPIGENDESRRTI